MSKKTNKMFAMDIKPGDTVVIKEVTYTVEAKRFTGRRYVEFKLRHNDEIITYTMYGYAYLNLGELK